MKVQQAVGLLRVAKRVSHRAGDGGGGGTDSCSLRLRNSLHQATEDT